MHTSRVALPKVVSFALCGLVLCLTSACAPRGETKTLDEIVRNSEHYFSESLGNADVTGPVREEVKSVGASIGELLKNESVDESTFLHLAESIERFIPKAGYTNRPAFTQLERQWRDLASEDRFARNAQERPRNIEFQNSPALRMLAARTLRTFARELETTGFRV